ncbi:MAG: peptide chain release factor aRF-1 [Candidatus Heimdallarchaeota archaeon]|nr:peptide chain release factor aRF-1 [Candidatus Heimdallarchaeota archaeon]MCK4953918.1 peptide chain release factor aRF-1 [Candidatus Heimdallarchaeota archaeon]
MTQTEDKEKKRTSVERYLLKHEIEKLEAKRSHNMSTSLISLYIPPGTRLSDINSQLRDEYGTATNIKDKNTGKAVQAAISSIMSRMKNLSSPGENGLVIFCGITQSNKVEYFLINPPEQIGIKLYLCDYVFHINHLKEMLESKKRYGLAIVARGGATIATIQGSRLNIIREEDSYVPGKHKMGGQSQARFQRLTEEAAQRWYTKVAGMMNEAYLEDNPVEAIIIGGPALSKAQYLENKELDYRLREKVIGIYDVGYTGIVGIRELLDRAQSKLTDFELVRERLLTQKFMENLGKDTGLATYGEKQVRDALERGAVEVVLVSEDVDRVNLVIKCEACDYQKVESVRTKEYSDFVKELSSKKCPKCNEDKVHIDEEKDLITELNELAESSGASLEVISTSHEDGATLYGAFGGVAAILRYKLYEGY